MWTFSQSSGLLTAPDGERVAEGYSGHGAGLKNPALQNVPNVGPLPRGLYTIGELQAEHDTLGKNVMALTPDPSNDMFSRGGFFMHGDTKQGDESASHGCPVLPLWARLKVSESQDKQLSVVL